MTESGNITSLTLPDKGQPDRSCARDSELQVPHSTKHHHGLIRECHTHQTCPQLRPRKTFFLQAMPFSTQQQTPRGDVNWRSRNAESTSSRSEILWCHRDRRYQRKISRRPHALNSQNNYEKKWSLDSVGSLRKVEHDLTNLWNRQILSN